MTRLKKHGEFSRITPEQKKEYYRIRAQKYRAENPDKIQDYNRRAYIRRRKIKPYTVICHYCGKSFNAVHKCIKTCPDCLKELQPNKVERAYKSYADNRKYIPEILKLIESSEWSYKGIAEKFNINPPTVSRLARLNGIYRKKRRKND